MAFKTISVLAAIVALAYGSQPGSHFQPPFGGNSGYSGNSGYNSNSGYNGNSGNNGNPGFNGNNGYSANNGNNGNFGYSGNYNSGPQIPILRYENVNNGDGNYRYNYETGNGISAHESGSPRAAGPEGLAVTAEGGFSYRAPDVQQISISYTADENGFHPVGSHIPTPPPIPEAILRSIEFNRQNPSNDNDQYNARSYDQQGGNHGGYRY